MKTKMEYLVESDSRVISHGPAKDQLEAWASEQGAQPVLLKVWPATWGGWLAVVGFEWGITTLSIIPDITSETGYSLKKFRHVYAMDSEDQIKWKRSGWPAKEGG